MRPTPRRVMKSLCLLAVLGFIVVNISLFGVTRNSGDTDPQFGVFPPAEQKPNAVFHLRNKSHALAENESLVFRQYANESPVARIERPPAVQVEDRVVHSSVNASNNTLRQIINDANQQAYILNRERFEWEPTEDRIVIVVQVHNRGDYLRHLIASLKKARDIDKALLIFSHDFYSEELNSIIHTIDFCSALQIFYPYSMQLYPNVFPGVDPNDCPRDAKKQEALASHCNNAESPDKYGHYREAKYSQTKHHWFWKVNHVFDHLSITDTFQGPVLLLEEDHYVVEDFIPTLLHMYQLREKSCKDCNIMTLGTYDKKPTYGQFSAKVEITGWVSSKHNMGMSFNRAVWNTIKACAEPFCNFDDYNWDWSLQFISMSCIPGKLRVMFMKSPRVFHIGECGMHAKGKNCDPAVKVDQISQLLYVSSAALFPAELSVNGFPRTQQRLPKANGGWGDTRDHRLCHSFIQNHTHR